MLKTGRFTIVAAILQVLFIVLFAVFVRYPDKGLPVKVNAGNDTDNEGADATHAKMAEHEVAKYYPCKYAEQ